VRSIVLAAVLLHDVGKPSTTRLESGKLTSRGHSLRGDNLVRVVGLIYSRGRVDYVAITSSSGACDGASVGSPLLRAAS
jgi:hypothetical protein